MDQLIALIIVCGCLGLLFAGINSEIKSILAVAAGWLFGGVYMNKRPTGGGHAQG